MERAVQVAFMEGAEVIFGFEQVLAGFLLVAPDEVFEFVEVVDQRTPLKNSAPANWVL